MRYFLYLRRCFTRAAREQMLLLLVMVLSISLPITMSVLYDSYVYGDEQEFLDHTKGGHTVRVENVAADEVAFFAVFEDYTQIYSAEEEVLFLDPPPEVDFNDDPMALTQFDFRLQELLAEIKEVDGNDRLQQYIFPNLDYREEVKIEYRWFTVALLAFSLFTECAIYTLYLHKHTKDHGALLAMGATRGQLCLLTTTHLSLLILFGILCSTVLSVAGMRVLIERFFAAATNPSVWILFHYSPGTILVLCAICFVIPLCYGVLCGAFLLRRPVRQLLGADSSGEKTRHYRKACRVQRDPTTLLSGLFRRRCNRRVFLSAAVLLPVVILVLFLSVYQSAQYNAKMEEDSYDLVVSSTRYMLDTYEPPYFTEAEMDRIAQAADATICHVHHSLSRSSFMIIPRTRAKSGNARRQQTQLMVFCGDVQTPPVGSETGLSEEGYPIYHAVIHTNGYAWEVGEQKLVAVDTRPFQPSEEDLTDDGYVKKKRSGMYIVADEVVETEEIAGGMPYAYLYGDAYEELTAGNEIDSFALTLRDPSTHASAVAALTALSEEIPLSVIDYTVSNTIAARRAQGEVIFASTIAAFLLIFYAILIAAILREYFDSQRRSVRTLYTIGADEKSIDKAYLRQMYAAAATVYGAAILVCAILVWRYGTSDWTVPSYLRSCPLWVYALWVLTIGVYTFAVFVAPAIRHNRRNRSETVAKTE